jgi:hypothetical protein
MVISFSPCRTATLHSIDDVHNVARLERHDVFWWPSAGGYYLRRQNLLELERSGLLGGNELAPGRIQSPNLGHDCTKRLNI